MRFGEIIGEGFLKIRLSEADFKKIDSKFLACAHHYYRCEWATDPQNIQFHAELFWQNMKILMQIVYSRGDFSCAIDSAGSLHTKESWNPAHIPNELSGKPSKYPHYFLWSEMFDSFLPDRRFKEGEFCQWDSDMGGDFSFGGGST